MIITSNKYFKDLEKLLSKTPKRVVANYMLWRAARASINFSNKAIFCAPPKNFYSKSRFCMKIQLLKFTNVKGGDFSTWCTKEQKNLFKRRLGRSLRSMPETSQGRQPTVRGGSSASDPHPTVSRQLSAKCTSPNTSRKTPKQP